MYTCKQVIWTIVAINPAEIASSLHTKSRAKLAKLYKLRLKILKYCMLYQISECSIFPI